MVRELSTHIIVDIFSEIPHISSIVLSEIVSRILGQDAVQPDPIMIHERLHSHDHLAFTSDIYLDRLGRSILGFALIDEFFTSWQYQIWIGYVFGEILGINLRIVLGLGISSAQYREE